MLVVMKRMDRDERGGGRCEIGRGQGAGLGCLLPSAQNVSPCLPSACPFLAYAIILSPNRRRERERDGILWYGDTLTDDRDEAESTATHA